MTQEEEKLKGDEDNISIVIADTSDREGEIKIIENSDNEEEDLSKYLINNKEKKHQDRVFIKKTIKFVLFFTMVFGYFIAELVVGIVGNSLSLVSDAFHMLNDSISLVVGFVALLLSRSSRKTHKLTYGWGRSKIIGAMINSIFLLSVCLFIFLQTIEKCMEVEPISEPWLVFVIGFIGLVINLLGMIIFGHGDHDHAHGHGHGHGDKHKHGHKHKHNKEKTEEEKEHQDEDHKEDEDISKKKKKPKRKRKLSLNIAGVFLHVFGDFLGSIAVIIASVFTIIFEPAFNYTVNADGTEVIKTCTKNCFIPYLDPICSSVLAVIILCSTVPLFLRTAKILMQGVPGSVNFKELENEILKIEEIIDVHEFHVWAIEGERLVASMHIKCKHSCPVLCVGKGSGFMSTARSIQKVLHKYGIHSSTIQPEFIEKIPTKAIHKKLCDLGCLENECVAKTCCPNRIEKIQKQERKKLLKEHKRKQKEIKKEEKRNKKRMKKETEVSKEMVFTPTIEKIPTKTEIFTPPEEIQTPIE